MNRVLRSAQTLGRLGAVISITLAAPWLTAARANTGYFDGDGKTVWLSGTADVKLVSEAVEIDVHPGVAFYNCRFEMRNLTDETVTLQAGFPLTGFHYEGPGHGSAYPCDVPEPDIVASRFGFVAREADVTYHVRYARHDRDRKFEHLFLWDMRFEPRQTRQLHVSYRIGASGALGDSSRADAAAGAEAQASLSALVSSAALVHSYGYITETGASWSGTIDRAEFRLDISHADQVIRSVLGNGLSFAGALDFARAAPDSLGPKHVDFRVSPEGWQATAGDAAVPGSADDAERDHPLQYTWHFAPFEPGPVFLAVWMDTQLPATVAGVHEFARRLESSPSDRGESLRVLRAQLMAWHGITPKSPVLRAFVEQRAWFRAVPGRVVADLPPAAREQLALLDELIRSGSREARAEEP
jgi:hypothetical protein